MAASNRYCVIMAGGIGSRFWPASRRHLPKQFLDILGTGTSFIRHTFERFAPLIPAEHFLVVTNAAYRQLVLEQLPELQPEQVLCEPVGRNTAPCIAYAAFRLGALQPESTMVVAPSDHFIFDEEEFRRNISSCMEFAETRDTLVTIGIRPSRPDTGYGYIQTAAAGEIAPVASFREKPDLKTAMSYLAAGNYLWNAGIFIWSTRSILAALERHLPELYGLFAERAAAFASPDERQAVEEIYARCSSISIDYGVLERADNVFVRGSGFGWNDVGTWGSLYELSAKDDDGNVTPPFSKLYDTSGCLVKTASAEKVVVVDSLHDYIVVDTPDALLLCPRSREQHIKQVLEELTPLDNGRFV